ncbi:MAG: cobalamin-dependent protein [Rhodothermaceae bacterium]|nr:cobalamin-dependent protein [Rhodothermaceae bacterium]
MLNRRPELKKSLNRLALLKMQTDLANSIAHLSGSIVAGDPALFYDHIRWTENYYRHRGVKSDILFAQLDALLRSIMEFELQDGDNTPSGIIHSGIDWLKKHRSLPPSDEEIPVSPEGLTYAAMLLEGDEVKAEKFIHDLLIQKWGIEEIITDVAQQALCEVGRRWHTNQISSKRENCASRINRSIIMDLFKPDSKPVPVIGKCALYSPAGELHNMGISIFGELIKQKGFEVHKFGPNIPDSEFIACLLTLRPDALAISITMAYDLAYLDIVLRKIRQNSELANMIIVVGGYLAGKLKSNDELYGADIITKDMDVGINSVLDAIQVE